MDAIGLFTNTSKENGIECLEEALFEFNNRDIASLMRLILEQNIFIFNLEYFKQKIGAAIWSKPVPVYSNIFIYI